MIVKSTLCFVLLIVVYAGYLHRFPARGEGQHRWQMNVVNAQHYMYEPGEWGKDVVIGTSLSHALIRDSLPRIFMLTFPGQNAIDGIQILRHTRAVPRRVFVEMNFVLIGKDPAFTDYLFYPLAADLRRSVQFLQRGYEPLERLNKAIGPVLIPTLERAATWGINPVLRQFHVAHKQRVAPDQHINGWLKAFYDKLDTPGTNETFAQLKKQIDLLQQAGSRVYLYDVPVNNKTLITSPTEGLRQVCLRTYFPRDKYEYLENSDVEQYRTVDGVHLNDTSAIKFTLEFRDKIKPLL